MESLGATIKEHRQKKKMTLVQLGDAVSLSHGYLSNIENNNKIPTPEVLKNLSKVLDCSYLDLMLKAGLLSEEEYNLGFIDSDFSVVDEDLLEHIEANRNEPGDLEFYLKYKNKIFIKNKTLTAHQREQLLKIAKILAESPPKE